MQTWKINYGTGTTQIISDAVLDEVKAFAAAQMDLTKKHVTISSLDESYTVTAKWKEGNPPRTEEIIKQFDGRGYYQQWQA